MTKESVMDPRSTKYDKLIHHPRETFQIKNEVEQINKLWELQIGGKMEIARILKKLGGDAHLTYHYMLHYGSAVNVKGSREKWNMDWARGGVATDLELWEKECPQDTTT